MTQLEIEFFYPLTEQLSLDLDYSNCEKPKLFTPISNNVLSYITTGSITNSTTIQFRPTAESVGYWEIGKGLQLHNEKKPNKLNQKMTKMFFGWNWKDK